MEFRGTKGEWRIQTHGVLYNITCKEFSDWFVAENMGEHDAYLIASAPINLQEHTNCKNLLKMILTTNQLKDGDLKVELIQQIRISEQAISKALGNESNLNKE